MSKLELEIRAVEETLAKQRHITAYSTHLEIACSEAARFLIRAAPRLHPDLWARLIDIQQYRPQLLPEAGRPFPPQLLLDKVGDWEDMEEIESEQLGEVKEELKQQAYIPQKARFHTGPATHILFDGGSSGGKGTAGYVLIDTEGNELARVGLYLGSNLTNNEAESMALVRALRHYDDLM